MSKLFKLVHKLVYFLDSLILSVFVLRAIYQTLTGALGRYQTTLSGLHEIFLIQLFIALVLIKAGKMPVVYHCGAN